MKNKDAMEGWAKMFWNKIKSAEYLELLEKVNKLSVQIVALEIDLQLYVKKLRASKGLSIEKEKKSEDLNKDVLLNADGSFISHREKN